MLTIGLTGGVASGKSTVAKLFSELGINIISADAINRELIAPGSPCFTRIVEHFGPDISTARDELDKKRLREIIFSNPEQKAWLESLLHPHIRAGMKKQISRATSPYCIVEIPLLNKRQDYPFIDRVLVVDCTNEQQLARLIQRDQLSRLQAENILKSQIRREQRLALADDILTNDGEPQALKEEVAALDQSYRLSLKN